jgi:hypothetical protein
VGCARFEEKTCERVEELAGCKFGMVEGEKEIKSGGGEDELLFLFLFLFFLLFVVLLLLSFLLSGLFDLLPCLVLPVLEA